MKQNTGVHESNRGVRVFNRRTPVFCEKKRPRYASSSST